MTLDQSKTNAEVTVIQNEGNALVNDLLAMFPGDEINTTEDLCKASDALTLIAKTLKVWDTKRTEIVKPANDFVRSINELWKKVTDPVNRERSRIAGMMSTFKAKEEAKRAAEYQENLKKSAVAFPKGSPIPETVAPIPDQTIRKVETPDGNVGFMKVWKFTIVDPKLIPAEYMMVDEVKIGKVVKAGIREIPGVRIYSEDVPTVRGR